MDSCCLLRYPPNTQNLEFVACRSSIGSRALPRALNPCLSGTSFGSLASVAVISSQPSKLLLKTSDHRSPLRFVHLQAILSARSPYLYGMHHSPDILASSIPPACEFGEPN